MFKEKENKVIVTRWFAQFWGNPANVEVVDELGTPDVLVHYPMHGPRRGRENVKKMMTEFREAFPDLKFLGGGGSYCGRGLCGGPLGRRWHAHGPCFQ